MDGPNYPQITVLWVAHAYTLQQLFKKGVPVISISQSHICLSHLVLTTHRYTVEEEVGAFDTPAYYCRQLAPYLHMARKQEGGWPPYNSRERFFSVSFYNARETAPIDSRAVGGALFYIVGSPPGSLSL